jgi:hypothetical protein
VWEAAYYGINRANSVIDHVPTIDMDKTRTDQIVGEAKFLRADALLLARRLFGGVRSSSPRRSRSAGTCWRAPRRPRPMHRSQRISPTRRRCCPRRGRR